MADGTTVAIGAARDWDFLGAVTAAREAYELVARGAGDWRGNADARRGATGAGGNLRASNRVPAPQSVQSVKGAALDIFHPNALGNARWGPRPGKALARLALRPATYHLKSQRAIRATGL